MSDKRLDYYVFGHTARGFANQLQSSVAQLQTLIVFIGGSERQISTLIAHAESQLSVHSAPLWYLHNPSQPGLLDGLVAPAAGVGLINGTPPRQLPPLSSRTRIHELHLQDRELHANGDATDSERLDDMIRRMQACFEAAYASFRQALAVHDEWEAIYIDNTDFVAADALSNELAGRLYQERSLPKTAHIEHRFLGAATPEGARDYVPRLTAGLKRYLIKGRPGCGKSTMLKKLAAEAGRRGFDYEVYHCGFDPNSLDMLIVRELGFAIFDSTPPHEYFPERATDEIVDMYERCIAPGTDEHHAAAISRIASAYRQAMKEGIAHLGEARQWLQQIDALLDVKDSTLSNLKRHVSGLLDTSR